MQYPVIVKVNETDQFEAEPMGIPELKEVASTEADVLEKVEISLGEWFASAKVVQMEVGVDQVNPWMQAFGRSAEDPDFGEFQDEMKRIRNNAE
jgi:hypothetical protein